MLTLFQKTVLATIAGGALLLALVITAKGSAAGSMLPAVVAPAPQPAPGLATTGEGTVKLKADIAILTMGVTAQAATAAEAQAQLAERIARVLQRAKEQGVADRDTKNASYTINPLYASGPNQAPRITGYQATQSLSLTLRDVSAVGKALDALVQNDGATNAQVRFTLDDSRPAQADARRLAVEDARAKAEAMAKAAGVRLGKATSISDQGQIGAVPQKEFSAFDRTALTAQTQVPVGELDVVVRVMVQFAIE